MNRYTIYCTEEQTKKALSLGAPIVHYENAYTSKSTPHFYIGEYGNHQKGFILYIIPTAEQMIGWLEEQEKIISIETTELDGYWQGYVETTNYKDAISKNGYSSRKEAMLTAIDAALEYLINKKCL